HLLLHLGVPAYDAEAGVAGRTIAQEQVADREEAVAHRTATNEPSLPSSWTGPADAGASPRSRRRSAAWACWRRTSDRIRATMVRVGASSTSCVDARYQR